MALKIVYIGAFPSTDTDLPLIKALQEKGVEIISFFELTPLTSKSGMFSINNMRRENSVIPANYYEEFKPYEHYIDLTRVFLINNYYYRMRDYRAWLLWIKAAFIISKIKCDLLHSSWPFRFLSKWLYFVNCPKIFTFHDPIPHSGQDTVQNEHDRQKAVNHSSGLVILDKKHLPYFCDRYSLKKENVLVSKIGIIDSYENIIIDKRLISDKYILYFGQIQEHKGIEYLCEAMEMIHSRIPNVKLVIAGKGDFYFNIEKYAGSDYLIIKNYFITAEELQSLVKNAEFAVLPYKDATQSGVAQTAFTLGTPIIATDVGNLRETISSEKYGLIVPPQNAQKLGEAILSLLNDSSKLEGMRYNIATEWKRSMSWDVIADQYIAYYKTVLNERN